jgi:hypothetical protein
MKKVFKVDQLPSQIGKGFLEWELRDNDCNIQLKNRRYIK